MSPATKRIVGAAHHKNRPGERTGHGPRRIAVVPGIDQRRSSGRLDHIAKFAQESFGLL